MLLTLKFSLVYVTIYTCVCIGEMSVMYLFTRFRFNWSEVEFSIFSTYNMLTGLIGKNKNVFPFIHCNLI